MPFSSESGKHLIDRFVLRLRKENLTNTLYVLDIGVGSGTYFDRYAGTHLSKDKTVWTGVEIWEPYITKYQLATKYNSIIQQDAREYAAFAAKQAAEANGTYYDICFVGDIAEHMTKDEAKLMVSNLSQFCRVIVMSIPIVHYPQGEYEGNPYEAHVKDDWSNEEVLETFSSITDFGVENEIGVYFISLDPHGEWVKNLNAPRIAVYSICKNEERFAKRFADSVVDANYVVVCDTGSTDNTKKILRENLVDEVGISCVKHQVYDIAVTPWRFDDARNTAMMLVPEDADLCISLDLDEYLQEGWYDILADEIYSHYQTRGRLFDKYNCRFQTVWDWETLEAEGKSDNESQNTSSHWHERIHTRHNWKWRLPVHEVLTFTGTHQEAWAWLGGFLMTQKPEMKAGKHTYLPMLEQSVKEDPNVWKSWFFYAEELNKAGRLADAIAALKSAQKVPDCDQAYVNMMLGHYCAKTDVYAATSYYQQACQLKPNSREMWVNLAVYSAEQGNKQGAKAAIEKAKACVTQSSGYDFNPKCWGPWFDDLYHQLTQE